VGALERHLIGMLRVGREGWGGGRGTGGVCVRQLGAGGIVLCWGCGRLSNGGWVSAAAGCLQVKAVTHMTCWCWGEGWGYGTRKSPTAGSNTVIYEAADHLSQYQQQQWQQQQHVSD